VVRDPALYVSAIIVAVYAAFALICWALDIHGARVAPILAVGLCSAAASSFFLLYAVRW
jgi:hypothetical protein